MHTSKDSRNHFSPQLRNRLQTTAMGLGLVRLLLDAGRTRQARTTLTALQTGLRGAASARTTRRTQRCQGHRRSALLA